MRKPTITHRHLRKAMTEIMEAMEKTPDETFRRFEAELKHSCLIVAGDVANGEISIPTVSCDGERFGLLFH